MRLNVYEVLEKIKSARTKEKKWGFGVFDGDNI